MKLDFADAIVDDSGSPHTITATLTDDAKAALDAVDGLGFDGYDAVLRTDDTAASANAADAIDIAAGFIVDDAGNAATSDVCGCTGLLITLRHDGDPSIVKLYSTTEDVDDVMMTHLPSLTLLLIVAKTYALGDTFNVTAEMSETVLAGSSMTVTFGTGTNVVLTAAAKWDIDDRHLYGCCWSDDF